MDPVEHQSGEERVEILEMPVQHALRAIRFGGDGAAGESARPFAQQNPFRGIEKLGAHVAEMDPGGQLDRPL
ncbi:hypothetical protein GCM10027360_47870 [Amycolatopsis echigonensis]